MSDFVQKLFYENEFCVICYSMSLAIHYCCLIQVYTCLMVIHFVLSVSFAVSVVGIRMSPVLESSKDSDLPRVMFHFVVCSFCRAIK